MSENVVIIDSGLGGLTIFNHLKSITNNTCITYLADNKYFPYGNKEVNELIYLISRIIDYFLMENNQIIIACNTASIIYNKYLQNRYQNKNIYSIINTTIAELSNIPNFKKVGIIGTDNTIGSGIYENEIKAIYDVDTYSLACQDLVALCEDYDEVKILNYLECNLNVFKEQKIDALILGCTHFNIIDKLIQNFFDNRVKIICSGYTLVENLHYDLNSSYEKNQIFLTKYNDDYVKKIKNIFPNLKNIEIKELNI